MSRSENDRPSAKQIFTSALALTDPAARLAYLDRICGPTGALRQQVAGLLAAAGDGPRENPLDAMVEAFRPKATVHAATVLQTGDDPPPRRDIGPYKLLEQIGEGGFGTVYMAAQTAPLRRTVALKILKPGMGSKEILARFEAERQALAMMDHPNIARVLDAGSTSDGLPYFVMELVRGVPVTEYCDAARLTTDERLALFIDICRAVQHAHQKGIIHRDLKPTNVLVTMHDDKAVPKVIDFGIAKALSRQLTDRTLFTGYQQMLGTPLYMSPEQAQMSGIDVDTRSDVYSLGVMLYELLTGTTPFDRASLKNASYDDLRRMILEREPPRPSARVTTLDAAARSTIADCRRIDQRRFSDELRGELDWIVIKALEKDRTRRYQSATALAEDVGRYLSHQPVEACPPSAGYRFRKFAHRNRALLATSAIVSIAMLLGTAATGWQAYRAVIAEGAAETRSRQLTQANAELMTANSELTLAKERIERQASDRQASLVSTLLEKGISQYREGRIEGLLTLLEARRAASGAANLERQSAEILSVASFLLPGSVEDVLSEPLASAISDDGRLIAWCDARQVHLKDVETGVERRLEVDAEGLAIAEKSHGDHHDVLGMAFTADGRFLALNNPEQGVVRVWDLTRPDRRPMSRSHPSSDLETDRSPIIYGERSLAFTPDSSRLVTIDRRGVMCLWGLGEGDEQSPAMTFDSHLTSVEVSPTGRYVAVCESDENQPDARPRRIHRVDLEQWGQVDQWITGERTLKFADAQFVDDGDQILTFDPDFISRWDLMQQKRMYRIRMPAYCEDIAVSRSRNRFAAGLRDGTALLAELSTGAPLDTRLEHGGGGVRRVRFSPGEDWAATAGHDGTVQFWSLHQKAPRRVALWPQFGTVDQLHAAKDSGLLLSKARTRDGSQSAEVVVRRFPEDCSQSVAERPPRTSGFVPDKEFERFLTFNRELTEVQIVSRDPMAIRTGPRVVQSEGRFWSCQFHPDGRHILVCEEDVPGPSGTITLRMWDLTTEQYTGFEYTLTGNEAKIGAFINERECLYCPISWAVQVIDSSSGKIVREINLQGRGQGTSVCPARTEFCVGESSGQVRFYHLTTLEPSMPSLKLPGPVSSVCYSSDGQWLATVCSLRTHSELSFWNLGGKVPQGPIVMQTPYSGGTIYPWGERRFVFAAGDEIRTIELPAAQQDLESSELATWVATGLRQEPTGEVRLISSLEYRALRKRWNEIRKSAIVSRHADGELNGNSPAR
ncbi:Serine/threonine-protein kinase PknB [Caulifigura coniformis]|uniref:Serine/threonine-protein kinase PknB n=1 Tax=Caulifigura coniformis TaxID=2527983 RepID=A0A517SLL4_9PLAN|nr:WD40 repeat domain-containing serine/threonine-protein kinase [Caulifigura coniformis]QDT57016.1 Serine/threonine-protein kinase PknB [Caulifigura coniformis]